MKIIRPLELRWVALFVHELLDSVDELQWSESWKIFHSNFIGSPSIVLKVLCWNESLNQPKCSSQTVFDVGFRFTFPRHYTESQNTNTFACERLMTSSSLTKKNCFHGEFSQLIWDTPKNPSDWSTINFSDMSNFCFKMRFSPFWWSAKCLSNSFPWK